MMRFSIALVTLFLAVAHSTYATPVRRSMMPVRRSTGINNIAHIKNSTGASKVDAVAATTSAKLVYYGGPLISSVEVHPIWWGGSSSVSYSSNLVSFYKGVTNSVYMDWLSEYNSGSYSIGRGTVGTQIDYTSGASSGTVTDATIQSMLKSLADSGKITPTANTYFPVHFKSGITINSGGDLSCQVFCAYHSTISYGSGYIYYGVIPDQGGSCAGGCGSASTTFANLCSVSSHELIEAVTDPAVGLATDYASPLAWYDKTNGEISDICNAVQGTVTGGDGKTYTVQKNWSNAKKSCIISK